MSIAHNTYLDTTEQQHPGSPVRQNVRAAEAALDTTEQQYPSLATYRGIRVFEARNGKDLPVFATVLSRRDGRASAASRIPARTAARHETAAEMLTRMDAIRAPVVCATPARLEVRSLAASEVAARQSARRECFSEIGAHLDAIRIPTIYPAVARFDARQLTSADVLARFDAIKIPTLVIAPARLDSRARADARIPARLTIYAIQNLSVAARISATGTVYAEVLARQSSRQLAGCRMPARHHAFVQAGWRVYARNVATGQGLYLGFVPKDAATHVIENVNLSDGTWEIDARPAEFFWSETRGRQVKTIMIAAGALTETALPAIHRLESTIERGVTILTWYVNGDYPLGAFQIGLWYDTSSPVPIGTRPPDTIIEYTSDGVQYQAFRRQTQDEYVSVAAFAGEGPGQSAELYLPLGGGDGTLVSPPDQHAEQPPE